MQWMDDDVALTCWKAGLLSDRFWNFPAAQVLIPDGFPPDFIIVAVIAVAPYEGLHLVQDLLVEKKLPFLAPDDSQVVNLLQLKF